MFSFPFLLHVGIVPWRRPLKSLQDRRLGTKPRSALYNHDGTITVTMTGKIEGSLDGVFSVEGRDGGVVLPEAYRFSVTDSAVGAHTRKVVASLVHTAPRSSPV